MASTHDYIIDKRNENIFIYVNGKFFPRSKAKVSVFDSGFLLGDGVWEGIRLIDNNLVHLDEHLSRLFNGARSISMEIPLSKKDILAGSSPAWSAPALILTLYLPAAEKSCFVLIDPLVG